MNKEILNNLADLLDTVQDFSINEETGVAEGFCMRDFFHQYSEEISSDSECGTPSCIAGHLIFMTKKFQSYPKGKSTIEHCASIINLDYDNSRQLFLPDTIEYEIKSPWNVNAKEAATVVRNLVSTGNVDWTIVCGAATVVRNLVSTGNVDWTIVCGKEI